MSRPRLSVQNRPTDRAIQAGVYGFLTTATLIGGVVLGVAADQVRKYRNERRLAHGASRR